MTITVPIPTFATPGAGPSRSPTSYTASPIRCSPLSQPPLYAPTRTPSPLPPTDREYQHRRQSYPHDTDLSPSLHSHTQPRPQPIPHTPRRPADTASASPSAAPSGSKNTSSSSTSPCSRHVPYARPRAHDTAPHATPSPPQSLSRSHPLLGSYPLSLLHSRMSHAHAAHSLTEGFTLHINAVGKGKGKKDCPPELRCPSNLAIPFSATYYDLEDPELGGAGVAGSHGSKQTPWVGTVDLEGHYFERYSSASSSLDPNQSSSQSLSSSSHSQSPNPPSFPGYQISPRGQLQILIKSPTQPIKVFVIPYDLRSVPLGGRLLVREKTYVRMRSDDDRDSAGRAVRRRSMGSSTSMTASEGGRESLRYAVQLQFCCVPACGIGSYQETGDGQARQASTTRRRRVSSSASATKDSTPELEAYAETSSDKAYFISKYIRVVFPSTPPDPADDIRVERTDEMVPPQSRSTRVMHPNVSSKGWEGELAVPVRGRGMQVSGFSPGSLGSRGEEWEMIKQEWAARKEVEAGVDGRAVEPSPAREVLYLNRHRPGSGRSHETTANTGEAVVSERPVSQYVHTVRALASPPPPAPRPPILDIPPKIDRPKLNNGNRGPSLLSVTSPSAVRHSQIPRAESPISPTLSATASAAATASGTGTLRLSSPPPSLTPLSQPEVQQLSLQILSPRPIPVHRPTSALSLSRPTTPLSPRAISPHPHAPPAHSQSQSIWSPVSLRRARREDVLEEQELSERLRKLEMDVSVVDEQ